MTECRFCAKTLVEGCFSAITEQIRESFTKITQIEPLQTVNQYICELCLRSIQLAYAFRSHLLENEQKLYSQLELNDEEPIQYYDPPFESSKSFRKEKRKQTTRNVEHDSNSMDYEVFNSKQNVQNNSPPSNPILNKLLTSSSSISMDREFQNKEVSDVRIKSEKDVIEYDNVLVEAPDNIHIKMEQEEIQDKTMEHRSVIKIDKDSITSNIVYNSSIRTGTSLNPYRNSEKVLNKNPKNKKFECTRCDFTAELMHVVKSHIITAHNGEIKNFKCPHCDSTYFKGSNLKRHVLVKHMNHRCDCVVPGCTLKFQDRSGLRKHLFGKHSKEMSTEEFEVFLKKTRKESGPLVNLPKFTDQDGSSRD